MTMSMALVIVGALLFATSGVPGICMRRGSRAGDRIANMMVMTGALATGAGACAALAAASRGDASAMLALPASPPLAAFHLRIDALSAFFLLPGCVVAAAASLFGVGSWSASDHPRDARKLRLFFGLAVFGLIAINIAGDAIVLLFGWEVLAISSFMIVTTDDCNVAVQRAGKLYLDSARASSLALIAMCVLWRVHTGSWELLPQANLPPAVFVLALVAFGIKAGVVPLHFWLPSAHASAPSHVSALMSGVLIKAGIYGLVRIFGLATDVPLSWGVIVFVLGLISSVFGVVQAIGQHDLKRLLAFHSIENIGIILLGLGLALIGRATGSPAAIALGLAGALLHTWNHGLFKALLFLAAGAAVHATGLREIDRMGGLARRMPVTALAFLIGAIAISGLPPLNGFVSEFFVMLGMIDLVVVAGDAGGTSGWILGALGVPALALVGGLAMLCFAKVFGVVFLGEPRCAEAARAHPTPRDMLIPMAMLAGLCVLIGVAPLIVVGALDASIGAWGVAGVAPPLEQVAPLAKFTLIAVFLVPVIGCGWLLLRPSLPKRAAAAAASPIPTWGCAYSAPTPRMQYTGSSFAQLQSANFRWLLFPIERGPQLGAAPFPVTSDFASHARDPALDLALVPVTRRFARLLEYSHRLQSGSAHMSLLYVLIALFAAFMTI